MKKLVVIAISLCCMIFTACNSTNFIFNKKVNGTDFSYDGYFKIAYSVSNTEPKVNESFDVDVTFTNITVNTFKAGIEQPDKYIYTKIRNESRQSDEPDFCANSTPINKTIEPNQSIRKLYSYTIKEKGKYTLLIYSQFQRELLPTEDKLKTQMSVNDKTLAFSYVIAAIPIEVK